MIHPRSSLILLHKTSPEIHTKLTFGICWMKEGCISEALKPSEKANEIINVKWVWSSHRYILQTLEQQVNIFSRNIINVFLKGKIESNKMSS